MTAETQNPNPMGEISLGQLPYSEILKTGQMQKERLQHACETMFNTQ